MRIRRATGLRILEAREFVKQTEPELVRRILTAYDQQIDLADGDKWLHDPVEDDPRFAKAFEEAEAAAQFSMDRAVEHARARMKERGLTFSDTMLRSLASGVYTDTKKGFLKHRYGIDWYDYHEMNPGRKT